MADADLMTLLNGLELVCLSASPDSRRWRALRAARSLMAFGVDGETASGLAAPPPLARSHTSPELPAETTTQNQTVGLQEETSLGGASS